MRGERGERLRGSVEEMRREGKDEQDSGRREEI